MRRAVLVLVRARRACLAHTTTLKVLAPQPIAVQLNKANTRTQSTFQRIQLRPRCTKPIAKKATTAQHRSTESRPRTRKTRNPTSTAILASTALSGHSRRRRAQLAPSNSTKPKACASSAQPATTARKLRGPRLSHRPTSSRTTSVQLDTTACQALGLQINGLALRARTTRKREPRHLASVSQLRQASTFPTRPRRPWTRRITSALKATSACSARSRRYLQEAP